jgi:hypothetical protein
VATRGAERCLVQLARKVPNLGAGEITDRYGDGERLAIEPLQDHLVMVSAQMRHIDDLRQNPPPAHEIVEGHCSQGGKKSEFFQ